MIRSRRTEAAGLRRWGLPLALAGLTLLAAWPLLRGGYPSIGDGLIHFYRLVQFDHLLRSGVWYPRWATDLGYGFGYPVFNYYSPITSGRPLRSSCRRSARRIRAGRATVSSDPRSCDRAGQSDEDNPDD